VTSRHGVPVSRFPDELGISIASFKRDIEHLRSNLDAPIEWDRSCRGYRLSVPSQSGPRYELPGVWFNAGEIHALLTIEHLYGQQMAAIHIGYWSDREDAVVKHGGKTMDAWKRVDA